jgi:hypothetical protein
VAFVFLGWIGLIVLLVVLLGALGISYRVMIASDTED